MTSPLRILTADGQFSAHVAWPRVTPAPAVVVLQEIFGVNDDMRATCSELAANGFIGVCPDLFWRLQPGVDLNSWSEEEWKRGIELYKQFDLTLGTGDVAATVNQVANMQGCTGRVGVMGFCLGGLLTYLTAARYKVDAAVAYYGGATEQHLDEAKTLGGPLMMHLASDDEFMSREAQQRIQQTLAPIKDVSIHVYAGQRHAFARHTGMHYDAASAQQANTRTIEFFTRHLAA